jgi:hypothetical protein
MDTNSPSDTYSLWNEWVTEDSYGPEYTAHVFAQYKLYVEMADQVSTRRNLANTFFLTLHTLLLGAIGFSLEKGVKVVDRWVIIFPLMGILLLCLTWWMTVRSYRQLNTAKFKIVGEFEKRLPASPYWCAEWKALGEGKDRKQYLPVSQVENWVPLIFAFLFIALTILLLFTPGS